MTKNPKNAEHNRMKSRKKPNKERGIGEKNTEKFTGQLPNNNSLTTRFFEACIQHLGLSATKMPNEGTVPCQFYERVLIFLPTSLAFEMTFKFEQIKVIALS
jgi:hypothetical protein